jgi:hypothetical protein
MISWEARDPSGCRDDKTRRDDKDTFLVIPKH